MRNMGREGCSEQSFTYTIAERGRMRMLFTPHCPPIVPSVCSIFTAENGAFRQVKTLAPLSTTIASTMKGEVNGVCLKEEPNKPSSPC